MNVLYEELIKFQNDSWRFQAGIHGIKMDKKHKASVGADSSIKTDVEASIPLFGDPEDYKHLSKEDQEEMTRKMLGKHQSRFGSALDKKQPKVTRNG